MSIQSKVKNFSEEEHVDNVNTDLEVPSFPRHKGRIKKSVAEGNAVKVDAKMVAMKEKLSIKSDGVSAKENEEISPAYVAKIPKSYVPNVLVSTTSVSESLIMPTISASEGAGEIDKKIDEDDKISIRASSILRPRAVLSSPDNDVMIGNKNRVKARTTTWFKADMHSVRLSRATSLNVLFTEGNPRMPMIVRATLEERQGPQ